MRNGTAEEWFRHFHERVSASGGLYRLSSPEVAKRKEWTACMTDIISDACRDCGLFPAAKANQERSPFPKENSEYLSIDVMAFGQKNTWTAPILAIEIENRSKTSKVAPELGIEFALWKVLQLSCPFKAVVLKRDSHYEASKIVKGLEQKVIQPLRDSCHAFYGETYIGVLLQNSVRKSSTEGESKPIDFFWSRLNPDTGNFENVGVKGYDSETLV